MINLGIYIYHNLPQLYHSLPHVAIVHRGKFYYLFYYHDLTQFTTVYHGKSQYGRIEEGPRGPCPPP